MLGLQENNDTSPVSSCKISENNDDSSEKRHQAKGYDLSPFQPEVDKEDEGDEGETDNETVDTTLEEKKTEDEESLLLRSGNCKKQLARIEIYNSYIVDSDSEDDDKEEGLFVSHGEEVDHKQNEWPTYTGLSDHIQDGEINDEFGSKNFIEEFNAGTGQATSTPQVYNLGNIDEQSFAQFDNGNQQIDVLGSRSEPPMVMEKSFSNAIPLIKPPPKEKMHAYLKSKGLTDFTCSPHVINATAFDACFNDTNDGFPNITMHCGGNIKEELSQISNEMESFNFNSEPFSTCNYATADDFFKGQGSSFECFDTDDSTKNDGASFDTFDAFQAFET